MLGLTLFAVSFAASALGGVLGMAGGIFIVPALTLFFGIEIRTAVGASIVSVIACSCAGAAPYLEARLTNVRLAITLEVATTIGALTGVLLSGLLSARLLFAVFAGVLAVSALQMYARRNFAPPDARPRRWSNLDGGDYIVDRLPLGMGLMYGAG